TPAGSLTTTPSSMLASTSVQSGWDGTAGTGRALLRALNYRSSSPPAPPLSPPSSESSPPPASISSTISSKSSPASSPSSLPILRIQRAMLFGSFSSRSPSEEGSPRSSSRSSSERTRAKRDMRRASFPLPQRSHLGSTCSLTRSVSTVVFRPHSVQRYS